MAWAERFLDDRTAELFAGGLPWRPGAREALRLVEAWAGPTALVTNTDRALTEAALDSIGREHFTVSGVRRRGAGDKAGPAPYLPRPSCSAWPGACLAVEDSPNGALAAEPRAPRCSSSPATCRCPAGPGRVLRPSLVGLTRADLQASYAEARTRARRVRPPVVPGDPLGSQGDYSRYRPFLSARHGRRVQQVSRTRAVRSDATHQTDSREGRRGVKTFDELFDGAEREGRNRPAGSATVAALDAGVHAQGKKVLEEAGEVWLAAEHEADDALAEEISQLLYRLQVLMLGPRSRARRRVQVPVGSRTQVQRGGRMLRIALPNKGPWPNPPPR